MRKTETGAISLSATDVSKSVACGHLTGLEMSAALGIGLDVALEALLEARREHKARANDLWRFAKINRVANVMRPYMEAIS